MSHTHEGGCLCGSVRYQVTGAPEVASICHCRYCQLRSGSAFGISVYFAQDQVQLGEFVLQSESVIPKLRLHEAQFKLLLVLWAQHDYYLHTMA